MNLPGLRNSVADTLSRQPSAAGYPDDINIGGSGSRLHALQDPVVFFAVKD